MNSMNLRLFVFGVFVMAFLLSSVGVLSYLSEMWNLLPNGARVFYTLIILVNFCSALLAYWVYVDDERLLELETRHSEEISSIKQKLDSFSRSISESEDKKHKISSSEAERIEALERVLRTMTQGDTSEIIKGSQKERIEKFQKLRTEESQEQKRKGEE